jgi:cytoskeletal protein CcmA (bactofilin family)
MFGKEPESMTGEGSLNSILGPGCKVKGNINLKGTIRVDGEFEGHIECPETLIIGKAGVVKADVTVKNAVIGGKLVGNIQATNKIELQTGSHVEGDIATVRLVIDEGVFYEGSCRMGTQAGTPPKTATTEKPWVKKETEKETEKETVKSP